MMDALCSSHGPQRRAKCKFSYAKWSWGNAHKIYQNKSSVNLTFLTFERRRWRLDVGTPSAIYVGFDGQCM